MRAQHHRIQAVRGGRSSHFFFLDNERLIAFDSRHNFFNLGAVHSGLVMNLNPVLPVVNRPVSLNLLLIQLRVLNVHPSVVGKLPMLHFGKPLRKDLIRIHVLLSKLFHCLEPSHLRLREVRTVYR